MHGLCTGTDFPRCAQPLHRVDAGAGQNLGAARLGPGAVVVQQYVRVAADGRGVESRGVVTCCTGRRPDLRAQPDRVIPGDPLHGSAGPGGDVLLGTDQQKTAGREHRRWQVLFGFPDEPERPVGQPLDHLRTVARDELPGRAGGGVVGQRMFGLDEDDPQFRPVIGGERRRE